MADLIPLRTTQQMPASTFAGLFGLFAGLCALFAACVTISDWFDEATQARWPLVSAVVDRADVVVLSRSPKDGGGTATSLRYRARYQVNGIERTAILTSRNAFSDTDAATLQSWAAQHRKGATIDVQYDPSQENRAAFASPDVSNAVARTGTDLLLLMVSAVASAGLLALAKYLRSRETLAATNDSSSKVGGGIAIGTAIAGMGLMVIGLALNAAFRANPLTADNFMAVPAGLMFVFAGALIALPPDSKRRSLLAALLITCFAVTFDWVAFGPGERKFGGGFTLGIFGFGFSPGELVGRIAFGFFAVLLDIFTIAMWVGEYRRLTSSARPKHDHDIAA